MSTSLTFLSPIGLALLICLSSTPGQCDEPIRLPLIKETNHYGDNRLSVPLVSIGDQSIDALLLLDTGSAGMSIDCSELFSLEECWPNGVKVDGEKIAKGIRITAERYTFEYEAIVEHGQLAFAKMAFGTPDSQVQTVREVPFLLRYETTDRKTGKSKNTIVTGVFGVSPIDFKEKRPFGISPISEVAIPKGLNHGYIIHPVGNNWIDCQWDRKRCPRVPSLQIGIEEQQKAEFRLSNIKQFKDYPFATAKTCIQVDKVKSCKDTLFDTGSIRSVVSAAPSKKEFRFPDNITVSVSGTAVGKWSFKTGIGALLYAVGKSEFNIVGVRFFEENSFLVDLDSNELGFRIGK